MRPITYSIGFALIIVAAALMLTGHSLPGIWMGIIDGIIILLSLSFERSRYKAELSESPGPDWQSTGERSVDTHGTVEVWFNPATGERAYVRRIMP